MNEENQNPREIIWVYDRETDTDSEAGSQGAPEDLVLDHDEPGDYSEHFTYQDHIALNTLNYQSLIKARATLASYPNRAVLNVPTASKIPSNCLHPWHYSQCIGINDLNTLAKVLDAPKSWRRLIDNAAKHPFVRRSFTRVTREGNVSEFEVELCFCAFVVVLSEALKTPTDAARQIRYGVGGLLAGDPNCAFIGKTDASYVQEGVMRFCSEIKTVSTFQENDLWYRESRAAQAIAPLYYCGVPIFLYSPLAFKLLLETEARDGIQVYPGLSQRGTAGVGYSQSTDLMYVVGLLILSKRVFPGMAKDLSSTKTPIKSSKRRAVPRTIEKNKQAKRRSARLAASSSTRPIYAPEQEEEGEEYEETELLEHPPIFFLTPEEIEETFNSVVEQTFISSAEENAEIQEESLLNVARAQEKEEPKTSEKFEYP